MTDDRIETIANRYRGLLERLEKTNLGAGLTDENQRRRDIFTLMENGENPVMRELGQELRAGNIDIDVVGSVPAYSDFLRAGMERLATLDVGAMADRLEALLETVETPADVREPAGHEMRDEDYETVVIFDDGR